VTPTWVERSSILIVVGLVLNISEHQVALLGELPLFNAVDLAIPLRSPDHNTLPPSKEVFYCCCWWYPVDTCSRLIFVFLKVY